MKAKATENVRVEGQKAAFGRREVLMGGLTAGVAVAAPGQSALAQPAQVLGVGRTAPDAPNSGAASVAQHRPEVPAPHGAVSAGHPLASQAGMQMLIKGGSAADAIVAAMAVLNVCEPWASGIAGNGMANIYEKKTGKVISLCFGAAAPKRLDDRTSVADLTHGPKAVMTPGSFGGWIELLRRFGKLPLSVVLEPAIGYARDGHPVDPSISETIARQQTVLAKYPTSAAIYLPGGQAPPPRSVFKNVPLSRSMQALADAEMAALKSGADRGRALQAAYDYFYTGPIAQEMARHSEATGGFLRLDDMRDYRPRWAEPVMTTYRGIEVHCVPLTSRSGLEMCEQLNLMEGFDFAATKPDSPEALHLISEAIKVTKADVYRYAADPASSPTPTDILTSKPFANQRRALINPSRAVEYPTGADLGGPRPGPRPLDIDARVPGDTTSLSAVDAEGNAVACTNTLGGGFGAGVIMGDTGMFCNNGLRSGSVAPYRDHPNFVKGGRIPLLGNCPIVLLEKGQFRGIFGSPGGETIGQTQFQMALNLIDRKMPIQAAIEAPRIALDAQPGFYTPGAAITVEVESRFSPQTVAGLRAMGHNVRTVGPYAIGSVQGVLVSSEGTRTAGADPRRMAYAVGY
jgi:gamma-glutamyltranspeptidase/glutathione hydrolase